jgi:hypothetical protein
VVSPFGARLHIKFEVVLQDTDGLLEDEGSPARPARKLMLNIIQ